MNKIETISEEEFNALLDMIKISKSMESMEMCIGYYEEATTEKEDTEKMARLTKKLMNVCFYGPEKYAAKKYEFMPIDEMNDLIELMEDKFIKNVCWRRFNSNMTPTDVEDLFKKIKNFQIYMTGSIYMAVFEFDDDEDYHMDLFHKILSAWNNWNEFWSD